MRTRSSTFSHSTRSRRGVMHQNRIVDAMAPHEIEAMQKKRDEEAAKRKLIERATRAEAKAKAIAAATETDER
ncbi:unnamed protein product, partial [Ectocarpus sp. 13 AM-2016]